MSDEAALIDVHSHLYPEWYLEHLRTRTSVPFISATSEGERLVVIEGTEGVPLTPAFWSLDEKLRFMDRTGIAASVLSPGNPWVAFLDGPEAVEWAGRINEHFIALAAGARERIYPLGVMPSSSLDDCVALLEHPANKELLGFIIGTEACRLPFDDPGLDRLWEAFDNRGSVVFIHPGATYAASSRDGLALTVGAAFPLETTLAAARLLLAQVPERFPRIRFLLAHGGGSLPFLLGRLDAVFASHRPPSHIARRFYTDSLVFDQQALSLVRGRLGGDRVMWGSDHPFSTDAPLSADVEVRNRNADAFLKL